MEFKLKVLEGKHAGDELSIHGSKFFIGRADDCQLRPGSDMISRHHCVLVVDEGYAAVRDLGSKNGTFVNSERVIGERQLHNGDRLKIGPLEFEIVLSTGVGGKKKPAVTGGIKEAAERAASITATASDIDVSAWLTPDAGQEPPAPHVTPYVTASQDTGEIDTGETQEVLVDSAKDAGPAGSKAMKIDPKAKKPPGKLPFTPPRVVAKDSRDAASQVLDKMRKRR